MSFISYAAYILKHIIPNPSHEFRIVPTQQKTILKSIQTQNQNRLL